MQFVDLPRPFKAVDEIFDCIVAGSVELGRFQTDHCVEFVEVRVVVHLTLEQLIL